jgi:hypothetical protein
LQILSGDLRALRCKSFCSFSGCLTGDPPGDLTGALLKENNKRILIGSLQANAHKTGNVVRSRCIDHTAH